MSREKGLASFSANFESQMAAPIDARMLVSLRADLITEAVWQANDGVSYAYKGMIVVVHSDPVPDNNGLYRLLNLPITLEANWEKIGAGGSGGTADHAALIHLGYVESGHTGFQRELVWDDDYNAYLIERPI